MNALQSASSSSRHYAGSGSRLALFAGFTMASLFAASAATEVIHYQRLLSLGSITNDGAGPQAPLIQGSDGALYGTTAGGGSNNAGTVFKLNTDGSGYQILRSFGAVSTDGARPYGALIEASDGLLYGTTVFGGTNGEGTVFKLNRDGTGYSILHSLTGSVEGGEPSAALIEGSDGLLYGTAVSGGGSGYAGTVFVLRKDGTGFHQLHRFGPGTSTDGLQPYGALLEASDGALYGTTIVGGGQAVGSIFKINKDGTGYRKLHAFGFGADGNPYANLIEGSDGALYGTEAAGFGGVFKMNKDGTGYQNLHGFNGDWPFSGLARGKDGALYGTTYKGGFQNGDHGTVYRLREDGSNFAIVYNFGVAEGDGINPSAGLVLGSDGTFYGTSVGGGGLGRGTVFRLLVNHAPVALCTDVVISADSNCQGDASIDNGSFDPDGDPITISQSPEGPYPLGTNQVTLLVTDSHGDTNLCTASVIVLDTTPPNITCPSNFVVEFTSDAGASVTYSVLASDHCDPNPSIVSVPPSGSIFGIGLTEVLSTARDASGNSNSCSFTVTVLGARGVKQNALAGLIALWAALQCTDSNLAPTDICDKLNNAIGSLQASLTPAFWTDETHVQLRSGAQVFQNENAAVASLCDLIQSAQNLVPSSVLQQFIDAMVRADRLLASVAITEAISAGVSSKKIEQAEKFLALGDSRVASGNNCGNGIEAYRNAWNHAVRPQFSPPVPLVNGNVQLEIVSTPGDHVIIQASTNLTDWIIIGAGTANSQGVVTFVDPEAGSHPTRYYRALLQ